jgi:flavin-dependent dehydrogenase
MRVAIVGAGPAGSVLGILLTRLGAEVVLFDDGRRPELLVGESLVPAVVPILQRLGLEEEAAASGPVKPGVSFVWPGAPRVSFTFARFAPAVFPYAYNIARPQFDDAVLARAVAAGVHRVPARAQLQAVAAGGMDAELALAPETLAAAPILEGRQPDLIVDATGRARHAARVLSIGAHLGPRKDVAHFAHFENFQWDDAPGQVLIAPGDAGGWTWCIPLKDRLSVGMVLGQEDAARLGRTPDERLHAAIATDTWLSGVVGGGKRVREVATYANYQLISQRGVGPGWVMIGDAFGFVDPMLSPGVFLALRSAELVADALAPFARRRAPSPAELAAALGSYATVQTAMLTAWQELIAYFYDGRMVALFRAGRDWMSRGSGPFRTTMQNHIERHVALQATGTATTGRYSRGLLRVLARYGLRGIDPAPLALR